MREAAQSARDRLQEAFRRADFAQRNVEAMVGSYTAYLPERAARNGLPARFAEIDARVTALVQHYLAVLDRFPLADLDRSRELREAQDAFVAVAAQLEAAADELDRFAVDHDAELTRIGEQVARARGLRTEGEQAVRAIADAADRLRDAGLDAALPELRELLAGGRASARRVADWTPAVGIDTLAAAVAELRVVAARASALAEELPAKVAQARQRRASLATRVEAVTSRRDRAAADLATLRREYSLGNWRDVDGVEERSEIELVRARTALHEVDTLLAATSVDWTRVLGLLEAAREALGRADAVVDAPGERLRELRAFREDPEAVFARGRFALRDAQMLVVHTPRRGAESVAGARDALARRLDAARSTLRTVHPDYRAALVEVAAIQDDVKAQVARFRALPPAGGRRQPGARGVRG